MSLGELLLGTAKDLLTMSENIKRVDARVDQIGDDLRGVDRRLMKVEVMIDLAQQTSRKRTPRELP